MKRQPSDLRLGFWELRNLPQGVPLIVDQYRLDRKREWHHSHSVKAVKVSAIDGVPRVLLHLAISDQGVHSRKVILRDSMVDSNSNWGFCEVTVDPKPLESYSYGAVPNPWWC